LTDVRFQRSGDHKTLRTACNASWLAAVMEHVSVTTRALILIESSTPPGKPYTVFAMCVTGGNPNPSGIPGLTLIPAPVKLTVTLSAVIMLYPIAMSTPLATNGR
jgi:hypothetical protein